MRPRRNAAARRASGLLLALVLAVSQASAWFHAVAISHVACPEHGEAIHGGAFPAGDAPAARTTDEGALRADVTTAGGHDHCGNAALLRWRDVALTAPASLAAPLSVSGPLAVAPAPVAASAAAIYRLAPKTSPPLGA